MLQLGQADVVVPVPDVAVAILSPAAVGKTPVRASPGDPGTAREPPPSVQTEAGGAPAPLCSPLPLSQAGRLPLGSGGCLKSRSS